MFNLGEEITLDTHQIPWIIWINLLILFLLLLLLLSYFGLFSLDSPAALSSPSPPSNISSPVLPHEAGGSREIQTERVRGSEGNTESDGSSAKDLCRLFHPCYYLDFAKKAFLQCLGIGSTPLNPNPNPR